MKKERDLYIDILRALCIVLVLIGHCIQYGSGEAYYAGELYFENAIFIFIYSFHMPLFALISGYLFSYSLRNKNWYEMIFVKVRQLIVPLFSWSIVSFFIDILKIIKNGNTGEISLMWTARKIKLDFICGPWFLWGIWWCSFAIVIIRKLFKDCIYIYILVTLLTLVTPDAYNCYLYKFIWPFFLLAYVFNEYDYKNKLKKIYFNKAFVLCCAIGFIIMLCFYNRDSYIYISRYTLLNKNIIQQIYNNIYRLSIGMIGSISIIFTVYVLEKKLSTEVKKLFSYVGKNTLGIYVISDLLFSEILLKVTSKLNGVNYLCVLFEAIIILILSILANNILKKNKVINNMFLGGK